MSRWPRSAVIVIATTFGIIAPANPLRGQTVRARVVDAATQRPIAGVSVFVADSNGTAARSAVTNDSGRATLQVAAGKGFFIAARHIGHAPVDVRRLRVGLAETIELPIAMDRIDIALDTVRVVAERRKKPWYADISDGRDVFARHFREGKGVFIGGREIEASGLVLSEFLATVPGLVLSGVRPVAGPAFRTIDGRYLTSERGAKCLIIKTDRPYRYGVIDGIDPMTIMGVEVYRDVREVPAEWRNEAWNIPTGKTTARNRLDEPCGYVRVWTTIGW